MKKKHIIWRRPLASRELAWALLAVIAFIVASATLFYYPILAIAAFGASIVALSRVRYFWRSDRDPYRLYLVDHQRLKD
jgi:hypothetical protein